LVPLELTSDSPVMNETLNVMATTKKVKEWDNDQLLHWIQEKVAETALSW
jgi:hypothetical protein